LRGESGIGIQIAARLGLTDGRAISLHEMVPAGAETLRRCAMHHISQRVVMEGSHRSFWLLPISHPILDRSGIRCCPRNLDKGQLITVTIPYGRAGV
jgi:hypothetical protein